MSKPKILFILHMPPPVHGAAIVGKNIFESKIINESFDCVYINLSASDKLSDVGKLGIKKILFFFRALWNIVLTVIREKPNLVYMTPSSTWDWGFFRDFITMIFLKLVKKNIIIHLHNKGVSRTSNSLSYFGYRMFFKNIKVILLAPQLFKDIKKYVNFKNVYICQNGLPVTTDFNNFRLRSNNHFNILFLSNMMVEKGPLVLLEACKILEDRGHSFTCNFVGNWNDISEVEFKKYIREFELEKIAYSPGPQYGAEKVKFFEQADVFVFPTFYQGETFGLVLLEAMEYGLPCITTDEGGIPSIIKEGFNGLFSKKQDPEDLANKIEILIKNPELGQEMGDNGRKLYFEKFTLDVFEKNFKEILNNCIKQV